jgi:hypothetical protein
VAQQRCIEGLSDYASAPCDTLRFVKSSIHEWTTTFAFATLLCDGISTSVALCSIRQEKEHGRSAWRHARSLTAEASDPHDRICALLGIAKDTLGIEPNYSIPTDLLYCLFMKTQIQTHGTDSRHFAILSAHHDRSRPRIPGLPSWVPDFAVRAENPIATISPGYPRRYSACGTGPTPSFGIII